MLKIGIHGNEVFIFAWDLGVKFLGVEESSPKAQQNTLLACCIEEATGERCKVRKVKHVS